MLLQDKGASGGEFKGGASMKELFRPRRGWSMVLYHPDPWADPKSRSPFGFHNLHHRNIRAQNWGIYFLDPPRASGYVRLE